VSERDCILVPKWNLLRLSAFLYNGSLRWKTGQLDPHVRINNLLGGESVPFKRRSYLPRTHNLIVFLCRFASSRNESPIASRIIYAELRPTWESRLMWSRSENVVRIHTCQTLSLSIRSPRSHLADPAVKKQSLIQELENQAMALAGKAATIERGKVPTTMGMIHDDCTHGCA
jgi:hypothetical protein